MSRKGLKKILNFTPGFFCEDPALYTASLPRLGEVDIFFLNAQLSAEDHKAYKEMVKHGPFKRDKVSLQKLTLKTHRLQTYLTNILKQLS